MKGLTTFGWILIVGVLGALGAGLWWMFGPTADGAMTRPDPDLGKPSAPPGDSNWPEWSSDLANYGKEAWDAGLGAWVTGIFKRRARR